MRLRGKLNPGEHVIIATRQHYGALLPNARRCARHRAGYLPHRLCRESTESVRTVPWRRRLTRRLHQQVGKRGQQGTVVLSGRNDDMLTGVEFSAQTHGGP